MADVSLILSTEVRNFIAGLNTADPFYPNLSFPLSVGKTWSRKVRFVAKYEQEKTIEADLARWRKVVAAAKISGARLHPNVSTTSAVIAGPSRLPMLVVWLISPSTMASSAEVCANLGAVA